MVLQYSWRGALWSVEVTAEVGRRIRAIEVISQNFCVKDADAIIVIGN